MNTRKEMDMTTLLEYIEDEEDAIEIPAKRLRADLKLAAQSLTPKEARYLVDTYYQMQENRKRSENQKRALAVAGEPSLAVSFLKKEAERLEGEVKYILGVYANSDALGVWSQLIRGIGPVISAGLLAHIDIERAPTVGHIWSYAGLNPNQKWKGRTSAEKAVRELLQGRKPTPDDLPVLVQQMEGIGLGAVQRLVSTDKEGKPRKLTADSIISALSLRPWNASLKTLCWKIGESFVKVSNHEQDIYGHIYAERKAWEQVQNEQGRYKDQADIGLARVGRSTEAYGYYKKGLLPPGQIHSRAKRYAVKLFLAHYHHVAYELHYGKQPPNPYVIDHMNHNDIISPPNWPMA